MLLSRLATTAAALLAAGACATTIPATDTTPPRVELRLNGPGIGSRTMTNPPYDNWDDGATPPGPHFRFVPGETYRFSVLVQDPGGVEQARLMLPDVLTLESHQPPTAEVGRTERYTEVVQFGNRLAPVTTLAVSGSFRAPEQFEPDTLFTYDGIYITALGYDFGGRAGTPNRTTLILRAGMER